MNNRGKENKAARFDGIFRAQVKDNQDPKQLGRVKVNVLGVLDGIPIEYLPWAILASPMFVGAGAGSGCFNVPDVDSFVWCFFEEGNHNQPVYFAEAVDGVHGLPTERTTNYPNRRVMKTKNGIVVYIDDQDKEVKVTHPSGTYVEIDSDGNVCIHGGDIMIDGGQIEIQGSTVDVQGGTVDITGGSAISITAATITLTGSVDIN